MPDISVPGLVRADCVEITPLHFFLRNFTGNTGRIGYIGLYVDGTIVYVPQASVIDKPWIGTLDDLGTPHSAPESFVKWRSVGFAQKPATVRNSSMIVRFAGTEQILRFTGLVPADSLFWGSCD